MRAQLVKHDDDLQVSTGSCRVFQDEWTDIGKASLTLLASDKHPLMSLPPKHPQGLYGFPP